MSVWSCPWLSHGHDVCWLHSFPDNPSDGEVSSAHKFSDYPLSAVFNEENLANIRVVGVPCVVVNAAWVGAYEESSGAITAECLRYKGTQKHILQSRTSAHEWAFHLDLSRVNSQNRAHVYSLDVAGDALRVWVQWMCTRLLQFFTPQASSEVYRWHWMQMCSLETLIELVTVDLVTRFRELGTLS